MTRHLLRRLLAAVPVLFFITFFAFLLANASPGDPALVVARQRAMDQPTAEDLVAIRKELRLGDPVVVRYLRWVGDAAGGDLGTSFRGDPILPTLLSRFGFTLQVAVPAMVLSMLIAFPVGVFAAVQRGSVGDHVSRLASLLGASVPSFALGYILIIVFSVKLHLLPVAGRGSWLHLVMPTATLALGAGASLARLVRSSLLETLGDDYVRTARSKGLVERTVVVSHGLRNSVLAVVTVLGMRFGRLLAGAAIVETVFTWPGIGRYVVESIYNQDYPAVQGFVVFIGTFIVVVNLIVDLLYTRLDPRISSK